MVYDDQDHTQWLFTVLESPLDSNQLSADVNERCQQLMDYARSLEVTIVNQQVSSLLEHPSDRWQEVFNALPQAIALLALEDGRYVAVNDRFCQIVQQSRQHIVGNTNGDLGISMADRQHLAQQVRQQGAISQQDVSAVVNNALAVWSLSAQPIELDAVPCLLVIVHSITQAPELNPSPISLQTGESLGQSLVPLSLQMVFQAILDNTSAFIFVVDAEHRLLLVSNAYAQLQGTTPAQLIGKSMYDIWQSQDADIFAQVNRDVLLTGQAIEVEERVTVASGQHLYLTNKFPLYDDQGVPYAVCGIATDITDRKNIEQALQRNRDLLEAIFEESVDALFIVDIVTRLTLDCNRRALELFEVNDKSELLNIEGQYLQKNRFSDEELQAIQADIQRHGFWNQEIEYVTQQNRSFWGNLAVSLIAVADRQFYLVRVTDIDTRKRIEADLKIAKELADEANLAKSEFLATMSHELRTPLTSILGLSEILSEELFGPLTEKQHQYVDVISQSGKHLLELINDILDLAKIEARSIEGHLVPTRLDDLCHYSLTFIREQAKQRHIQLSCQLLTDIRVAMLDDRRMGQVLINLLSNAVKFTPVGGQVCVEVTADRLAESLTFTVTDTGIGIAETDMPKLFKPFVQLDSSLSRHYGGTGLGLALVRQVVDLYDGCITIESHIDQGSRFSVSIPLLLPPTDEQVNHLTPDIDGVTMPSQSYHLLLIDHAATTTTLYDALQAQNYHVTITDNNHNAISYAVKYQPNLIVINMKRPQGNSLDMMRQLRARPETATTPVIAITSLIMPGDRERCLEAGANTYLPRPFSPKRLSQFILKHLQSSDLHGVL